jgi:hypothetical protein
MLLTSFKFLGTPNQCFIIFPVAQNRECIVFLSRMTAQRHMMLSSVWMTQPPLSLTLNSWWDERYEDTGGDEAYRHCLLHASSWFRGSRREVANGMLADLRGDG